MQHDMSTDAGAGSDGRQESRSVHGAANPRRRHRRLPLWLRLALMFVGWALLGIGIAGLALPGIQGILTIAIAAAMLSAASETVYRLLRRLLERWPAIWSRIDRFRDRLHDRFSHKEE